MDWTSKILSSLFLWNFQNSNSDYIDNHKNGPGHKKLNYQIDSNNL